MIARTFSLAATLLFAASIGYFVWFYLIGLGRRAATAPFAEALLINILLFALFTAHHSVFARTPVRAWVARHVSPRLERSTYVVVASVAFFAVTLGWMPLGTAVWETSGATRVALRALQVGGVLFTAWSAMALDAMALAGMRQLDVPLPPSGVETQTHALQATGPYGLVRHPIYLGWLLIVWPAPSMTAAHLLFAALSTAYLVGATLLEERTLHESFGAAYADYTQRVRYRIVPGIY